MKHDWHIQEQGTNRRLYRYVWRCSACDQRIVSAADTLNKITPEEQGVEDCFAHVCRLVMEA